MIEYEKKNTNLKTVNYDKSYQSLMALTKPLSGWYSSNLVNGYKTGHLYVLISLIVTSLVMYTMYLFRLIFTYTIVILSILDFPFLAAILLFIYSKLCYFSTK